MKKTYHRRVSDKILFSAIGLAAITFGILLTSDWVRNYRLRYSEVENIRNEVKLVEEEILFKERVLEGLDNDEEAMEMLARRNLGLIKPGEVEFRFIPSTTTVHR